MAEFSPSPRRIARELGNQLRSKRRERLWTRNQLVERVEEFELSGQTLAAWELGTQAMSVIRLYQLCRVLDVVPHEVIMRTDNALGLPRAGAPGLTVTINLTRLLYTTRPELDPMRRWAATTYPTHRDRVVSLTADALEPLAQLCGLTPDGLLDVLREEAM